MEIVRIPGIGQGPSPTWTGGAAERAGHVGRAIVIVGGLVYFLMLILGPIGERIVG